MNLQNKTLDFIEKNKLIKKGDSVVIAVSGGPDSMTLLHVLNNLKDVLGFDICIAHVNHMIRKEADEETRYVLDFCDKLGISCYVLRKDVQKIAKEKKISTELAGRMVRYDFFEEVANKTKANKIATAHNANDNAETVLMNLIRGSGISGLKGIELIRDNKYIRPILNCTRQEIEEYAKENNLEPKYDSTNKENIYTRNKIRNELIPYLEKEFNPNIVKGINRLSCIATKEDKYLVDIVEKEFKNLEITGDNSNKEEIILDLKKFNKLNEVIKSRLILYTANKLLGSVQNIEKVNIEDIITLCGNNIGNKFLIPNKNLKVFVKKGKIYFIKLV